MSGGECHLGDELPNAAESFPAFDPALMLGAVADVLAAQDERAAPRRERDIAAYERHVAAFERLAGAAEAFVAVVSANK